MTETRDNEPALSQVLRDAVGARRIRIVGQLRDGRLQVALVRGVDGTRSAKCPSRTNGGLAGIIRRIPIPRKVFEDLVDYCCICQ
jgi:hypothetical protein